MWAPKGRLKMVVLYPVGKRRSKRFRWYPESLVLERGWRFGGRKREISNIEKVKISVFWLDMMKNFRFGQHLTYQKKAQILGYLR